MPKRNYALEAKPVARRFEAPRLDYKPRQPKRYRPRIGLIGCGGITATHLEAYRGMGWEVVALCDCVESAARQRREQFYPKADIYTDFQKVLEREDVDVVDLAMHARQRVPVVEAAVRARKHVLSQKPFVLDLDLGQKLVALADRQGCKMAVNQNGRWAPYLRYMGEAIRSDLIGEVQSLAVTLNWDHTWIKDTPFENMRHVVLYDFAIHWFDACVQFFGQRNAQSVLAVNTRAPGQELKPPLLASAVVEFDSGTATLNFDAHSRFAPEEAWRITGTTGTLRARGPVCGAHDVTLVTKRGLAKPRLSGKWFRQGFQGTMAELLCAIEEDREPANSARDNLRSLALCFAAVRSASTGCVEIPGRVRKMEEDVKAWKPT